MTDRPFSQWTAVEHRDALYHLVGLLFALILISVLFHWAEIEKIRALDKRVETLEKKP